jgi:hypothetical protein
MAREKRPTGPKGEGPSGARRYDVEMIRDFLDHLLWEVRINHYEQITSEVNPELKEQLKKYVRKRQTIGLLFATELDKKADPSRLAEYRKIKAGLRQSQLLGLEALRPLFEEALWNAARPGTLNVLKFRTIDDAIAALEPREDEHETEDP